MSEWDEAEWCERVRKAKNMDEVRALMEEIPLDDIALALTDDPMSTFTALRMIEERSKQDAQPSLNPSHPTASPR